MYWLGMIIRLLTLGENTGLWRANRGHVRFVFPSAFRRGTSTIGLIARGACGLTSVLRLSFQSRRWITLSHLDRESCSLIGWFAVWYSECHTPNITLQILNLRFELWSVRLQGEHATAAPPRHRVAVVFRTPSNDKISNQVCGFKSRIFYYYFNFLSIKL